MLHVLRVNFPCTPKKPSSTVFTACHWEKCTLFWDDKTIARTTVAICRGTHLRACACIWLSWRNFRKPIFEEHFENHALVIGFIPQSWRPSTRKIPPSRWTSMEGSLLKNWPREPVVLPLFMFENLPCLDSIPFCLFWHEAVCVRVSEWSWGWHWFYRTRMTCFSMHPCWNLRTWFHEGSGWSFEFHSDQPFECLLKRQTCPTQETTHLDPPADQTEKLSSPASWVQLRSLKTRSSCFDRDLLWSLEMAFVWRAHKCKMTFQFSSFGGTCRVETWVGVLVQRDVVTSDTVWLSLNSVDGACCDSPSAGGACPVDGLPPASRLWITPPNKLNCSAKQSKDPMRSLRTLDRRLVWNYLRGASLVKITFASDCCWCKWCWKHKWPEMGIRCRSISAGSLHVGQIQHRLCVFWQVTHVCHKSGVQSCTSTSMQSLVGSHIWTSTLKLNLTRNQLHCDFVAVPLTKPPLNIKTTYTLECEQCRSHDHFRFVGSMAMAVGFHPLQTSTFTLTSKLRTEDQLDHCVVAVCDFRATKPGR